ncbi:unnamed protein product [marine sediment metagenome]|uniref:Uncharacterized protein n=1 Tax=marine sediment metagenome TaxID=412755 RepID=X1BSW4_9ZZZZ
MTTKQNRLEWLDDPYLHEEEFDIFTPNNDGTPQHFKILTWEKIPKTFKLRNKDGGYTGEERESHFLETNEGYLRIDSIRLQRELIKVAKYKGEIILQRWVDDKNKLNTFYKIQKVSDAKEVSTKRS